VNLLDAKRQALYRNKNLISKEEGKVKSKVRWFLVSVVLILGIGLMGSVASWGDDAGPPAAAASTDGYTVVAQAAAGQTTTVQPGAPSSTTTPGTGNVPVTEVTVKAQKEKQANARPDDFVEIDQKSPTTDETVPKEMINILLNEAQVGSYKALEMLPSVNAQSADAYGMSLSKTLRLRGAFPSDEFLRTFEGLPVSGHGGGGDFIDFENIRAVEVYRGAMPVANSFGERNMTGGMDLSLLWPQDKFGITMKEGFGSDAFKRTYARIDSGLLPTGTAIFASFSTTTADKWRGDGGQPSNRDNFEMAVSQRLGDRAKIEIFGVYNQSGQNDYRALTYAQATHLSAFNNYDFNKVLTGVPAQDQFYYGFTRQYYKDTMFLGNIEVKPTDTTKFTMKPYYWQDNGYRLVGAANGYRYMATQPIQFGFIGQYDFSIRPVDLSLGYWYQITEDSIPTPLEMKQYTLNTTAPGSENLTYSGWTTLEKESNRNYNTPYARAKTTLCNTTLTGWLRYDDIRDPRMSYYKTAGLPDVSYDQIFNYNPQIDPTMQVASRTWHDWEPGFSVVQALKDNLTAYFAYGMGYEFDSWTGQSSAYTNNKAAFRAAGISFNELWNNLQPERLNNFDLGMRYKQGIFTVAPTIYYSLDNHKTVTVYDPVVKASYLSSSADATLYGAEIEVTARPQIPTGTLSAYLSGSFNHDTFNSNVQTASNVVVTSKGKQIPDTPDYMAKLGVTYTYGPFSVTPLFRWMSTRYGDIQNTQRVDGNFLTDLYMSYDIKVAKYAQDVRLSLSILNLFDKRYIGLINTSDFALSNSTTFYPGAPLTVMGGIMVKF
jgi:iron complex outermembrane receptor protein